MNHEFHIAPPPRPRIPLCYRAQYFDRVSVYRSRSHGRWWWAVQIGADGGPILYPTFDEAAHDAHELARVRAEREQERTRAFFGEHPPVEQVRALLQAAWA